MSALTVTYQTGLTQRFNANAFDTYEFDIDGYLFLRKKDDIVVAMINLAYVLSIEFPKGK